MPILCSVPQSLYTLGACDPVFPTSYLWPTTLAQVQPCPTTHISREGKFISYVLNRSNHHFGKAMGLKLIRFSNNPEAIPNAPRLLSSRTPVAIPLVAQVCMASRKNNSIYPTESRLFRSLLVIVGCRGVSRSRLLITLALRGLIPKGREGPAVRPRL
jgi:hypothetical protein